MAFSLMADFFPLVLNITYNSAQCLVDYKDFSLWLVEIPALPPLGNLFKCMHQSVLSWRLKLKPLQIPPRAHSVAFFPPEFCLMKLPCFPELPTLSQLRPTAVLYSLEWIPLPVLETLPRQKDGPVRAHIVSSLRNCCPILPIANCLKTIVSLTFLMD